MTTGIFTTSAGVVSYRYENQIFHSQYAPEKEVHRFLDNLGTMPEKPVFLVLGESLGYLSQGLKDRFPGCTIVALVPESSLLERPLAASVVKSPQSDEDFISLLEASVTESNFSRCRLVVWPAYGRIFPQRVKKWEDYYLRHFRMIQGSVVTQAHFGPRWLQNTLRNLQTFPHHDLPENLHGPVIIAASGPTLLNSRLILEKFRSHYFLLALPSSLRALDSWQLKPDAVMVTDGGYWSRIHLRYLPPEAWIFQCPSAVYAPEISNPRCFFSQDLIFENQITATDHPLVRIPSQGTVASSALAWGQKVSTGPVIVLGLDLAIIKERSHVAPHTFDDWKDTTMHRLRPKETEESVLMLESSLRSVGVGVKTSASLETYASFFQSYRPERPLFRLHSGHRKFPGFIPWEPEDLENLLINSPAFTVQWVGKESFHFGPRVNQWLDKILSELESFRSGAPLSPEIEKLMQQVWPLKSTPDGAELTAILERSRLNVLSF